AAASFCGLQCRPLHPYESAAHARVLGADVLCFRFRFPISTSWSLTLEPIQEVVESDESVVILCWRLIREGERPMWKPEHRIAADRSGLRYPSDLTGAEWALVEPMVPPGKHGGRKRTIDVREMLNGIFYVLWPGCPWQAAPEQ